MDGKMHLCRVGLALSCVCGSENLLKTCACLAGMVVKAELVRLGTRTCGNMEIKEQLVLLFIKSGNGRFLTLWLFWCAHNHSGFSVNQAILCPYNCDYLMAGGICVATSGFH